MIAQSTIRRALPFFCLALIVMFASQANAQSNNSDSSKPVAVQPQDDLTNLNLQLSLITASNDPAEKGNIPNALESVTKQLRSTLGFSNFKLATTLLGRVGTTNPFNVKGVAGSMFSVQSSASNPVFYDWTARVRIKSQDIIEINSFQFSVRIPIVVGVVNTDPAKGASSTIQYENSGVSTNVILREGEPTVVGTFNVGRADQMFIVVLTVQRVSQK
jgi:hypothetical protein